MKEHVYEVLCCHHEHEYHNDLKEISDKPLRGHINRRRTRLERKGEVLT